MGQADMLACVGLRVLSCARKDATVKCSRRNRKERQRGITIPRWSHCAYVCCVAVVADFIHPRNKYL